MAPYMLLLVFYLLTITIVSVSYAEDIVIFNSPPLVYRNIKVHGRALTVVDGGNRFVQVKPEWGEWDNCDKGEYAIGVYVYYESKPAKDGTAINGVCIDCALLGENPPNLIHEKLKCSRMTYDYDKKEYYSCPHMLTGFQVASDKQFGGENVVNTEHGYYFGITAVKFFCSNGGHLEFPTYETRPYTERVTCLAGQAVCGIRTQVDPHNRPADQEKLGLVNIHMKCCDIVSPGLADNCTASDKWQEIKSCDNVKGSKPIECKYETSLGTTKATMSSQKRAVMKALEAAKSVSDEFNADFDLIGLKARFSAIRANTTGYDWSKESSDTFQYITTTTSKVNVTSGIHTTLFQVVGTCGMYTVYSSNIVRVDTKVSNPAPTPKVLPSGFLCDKNSTTTGTNIAKSKMTNLLPPT